MKHILPLGLAALLLASSCSSDRQTSGTVTGATLGGIFGSAVGGLFGGPRGSDAGMVVGMVAGAAAGAAATAPTTTATPADDDAPTAPRRQRSNRNDGDDGAYYSYRPSLIEGLAIEDIRFVDDNRNQTLQPGERAKIVMNIYNRGGQTLYNVTPVISVNQKQVRVSPSAIVSSLRPGAGCTYTAAVYATPRLRRGPAHFVIAVQDGNRTVPFKEFDIAVERK